TSLKVLPGSYSQVRLIPVDPSLPATASAQAAGALYNSEVDYEDSGGNTRQLPLELLNPDQGIGIPTALKVPIGNVGAGLAAGSSTTGGIGTNDATGSAGIFDASGATNQGAATTTSTTGTTTTTTTASFAINMNGTTDLVPFSYAGGTAGTTPGCAPLFAT